MSKKGAAQYNKIRNGGYGLQFTNGYRNYRESGSYTGGYAGVSSYSARISSGVHHVEYSLDEARKKPAEPARRESPPLNEEDVKKETAVSQPKAQKVFAKPNDWLRLCAENKSSEGKVRIKIDNLRETSNILVFKRNYFPEEITTREDFFNPEIWVLQNLSFIPKCDVVDLHSIQWINVVNRGSKAIFIEENRLSDNHQNVSAKRFTIEPLDHQILELCSGVNYEIGIGTTTFCTLYKS